MLDILRQSGGTAIAVTDAALLAGVAHTRTTFRDADDPTQKRHLVRYWVRNEGPDFFV